MLETAGDMFFYFFWVTAGAMDTCQKVCIVVHVLKILGNGDEGVKAHVKMKVISSSWNSQTQQMFSECGGGWDSVGVPNN